MKKQKMTKEIMVKDQAMEKQVSSWGIPECLESNKRDILFKFDDEGLTDIMEKGYHCEGQSVKFCLYDVELRKVLFSMDFFKSSPKIQHLSRESKFGVTLELLYVHEESLRKRGIASYYFDRLREYAIHEKVECIRIRADANAKNFRKDSKRNALYQKELETFYKNRSTPEMPVELI